MINKKAFGQAVIGNCEEIFDFIAVPMWVYDLKSLGFLKVNQAAIRHYGYSVCEFLNMKVADIRAAGEMAMPARDQGQAGAEPELHGEKLAWHHTKNGKLIRVKTKSTGIEVGDRSAVLVVITDVTEEYNFREEGRQIVEKLKQREQKFQAMMRECSDLIALIDEDGNYQYVGPATSMVLGYDPAYYIGKNAFDFIHPDDVARISSYLAGAPYKKACRLPVYRFIDANGNWRWLETTITNLIDDPAVGAVVCNSWDITERLEKEDELRQSKERFELAVKASREMIWDWDHAKNEISRGEGYVKKFGHKLKEQGGSHNSWFETMHPEDITRVWDSLERAFACPSTTYWKAEYRLCLPHGEEAVVEDRCYILRDSGGKVIRAVGAVLDVSESRRNLEAIKSQNETLRNIAWLQSHVVRAPLARIMGLVHLMQEQHKQGENPMEEILPLVMDSANELDDVIREISVKTDWIKSESLK